MINQLTPYLLVNKLYYKNFTVYKNLYFLYKRIKEREEVRFLNRNIKPEMNIIDVGANIGFYSLILSDLIGSKGNVYSFEPEKNNFNHLKKICRNRKNIHCFNLAVGDMDKTINLYVSKELNVDHRTFDNNEKRKITRVKCISIDKFFERKHIDFIKVDTQGFEFNVLKGMLKTLKLSKRIQILSELSVYDMKKAGVNAKKYLDLIKSLGFKITYLEKDYKKRLYGNNQSDLSYVNIVASKKIN